jgi:hypothetical protein
MVKIMVREKIGEAQTDRNGKARINLPITDNRSFTVEAVYHELSKSKAITSIATALSLNIPSSVESGEEFNVNGLFLQNDEPAPAGIQINIIVTENNSDEVISHVSCKTNPSGEFSANLQLTVQETKTYVVHAEVNNYPSIKSENHYIDVIFVDYALSLVSDKNTYEINEFIQISGNLKRDNVPVSGAVIV